MISQRADSISALPIPLQLLRLLSCTVLSACLTEGHQKAKETKITNMLGAPQNAEHSMRLMLCQAHCSRGER